MTAPTITNGRGSRLIVVSDGFPHGIHWCAATLGTAPLDAAVLDRPAATDREQEWLDSAVMARLRPGGRIFIPHRATEHGPLDRDELLFLCQLIGPACGHDIHVVHMHVAEPPAAPPVEPRVSVASLRPANPHAPTAAELAAATPLDFVTSARLTTGGTE